MEERKKRKDDKKKKEAALKKVFTVCLFSNSCIIKSDYPERVQDFTKYKRLNVEK